MIGRQGESEARLSFSRPENQLAPLRLPPRTARSRCDHSPRGTKRPGRSRSELVETKGTIWPSVTAHRESFCSPLPSLARARPLTRLSTLPHRAKVPTAWLTCRFAVHSAQFVSPLALAEPFEDAIHLRKRTPSPSMISTPRPLSVAHASANLSTRELQALVKSQSAFPLPAPDHRHSAFFETLDSPRDEVPPSQSYAYERPLEMARRVRYRLSLHTMVFRSPHSSPLPSTSCKSTHRPRGEPLPRRTPSSVSTSAIPGVSAFALRRPTTLSSTPVDRTADRPRLQAATSVRCTTDAGARPRSLRPPRRRARRRALPPPSPTASSRPAPCSALI